MNSPAKKLRVLYSFPLKLGASRICTTAWHQVDGLAAAGADVTVMTASICRPLPGTVKVRTTMARGKFRVPNRLFSRLAFARLHDVQVARHLEKNPGQYDAIHAWPIGSLETLKTAKRLGIPTFLERPNAHTRFAYTVVNEECKRIGVPLPPGHEHAWDTKLLAREEEEYQLASRLICPSEFVVKTYLDQGFAREKLARSIYGVDEKKYHPGDRIPDPQQGLTMISVGVCAVRKGIHFALEAWLKSPASKTGKFLIAGEFLPAYREKLAPLLAHPSVQVLGHRNDIPDLVRQSDLLVLASIEEGFGLVCTEAMASGCVPLVSEACTDLCRHNENSLVHRVGDVVALTEHITRLHEDRALLARLRAAGLQLVPQITWEAAGRQLLGVYEQAVSSSRSQPPRAGAAASGPRLAAI